VQEVCFVQEQSPQECELLERLVADELVQGESLLEEVVQEVYLRRRFPSPQRRNHVLWLTPAKVLEVQWSSEM
jgi:hypothetical protein